MDLNLFQTDTTKSDEGVWCPIDPVTDIKIARYGNKIFQRALQREMKPYRRLMERGALDDDIADKILVTAIAEGILIDWRGMQQDKEDLPYSKDEAIRILLDKSLRDFRELVIELAQDMQLFRDEDIEEAGEKSQSSSDGKSSGASEKISSAA